MRNASKAGAMAATVAALVAVPFATAKPGNSHGNGHGPKGVAYVFKGTYVDTTTVDVSAGNAHAKRAGLIGVPVSFDFSTAKVSVADTNLDGTSDLTDVVAGDSVVVKVKAPRSDPGAQPFAARQLVDQTNQAESDSASAE